VLYRLLLSSGLAVESLPGGVRVANVGGDGRWFLDQVSAVVARSGQPFRPPLMTGVARCDLLRVVLDGQDVVAVHRLLPTLDTGTPAVLFEVPRARAGEPSPLERAVVMLLGELDYTVDVAGVAAWRDGSGTTLLVGVHPRRFGPRAQWEAARFDVGGRRGGAPLRRLTSPTTRPGDRGGPRR
jgi:hypothetical protein